MMNQDKIQSGRLPRLFDETGEAWYHLYNRIGCHKNDYPLEQDGGEGKRVLARYIEFYSRAYECELATYVVMGNHFHVMVRFPEYCALPRDVLEKRVQDFYPNTFEQSDHWSDEKWEKFNRRLFDVSSYMRNIQQGFAAWFNHQYQHRGRVWADRFKSTLCYGEETMLECMKYIDLNPLRAGLVERPEDYKFGALHLREMGLMKGLVKLKDLTNFKRENLAYRDYKAEIYFRGSVRTKENQIEINEDILREEIDRDFKPRGVFMKRMRFFIDGLVVGSKDKIEQWLSDCHKNNLYRRRKNPIALTHGFGFSLREQRSHFEKHLE